MNADDTPALYWFITRGKSRKITSTDKNVSFLIMIKASSVTNFIGNSNYFLLKQEKSTALNPRNCKYAIPRIVYVLVIFRKRTAMKTMHEAFPTHSLHTQSVLLTCYEVEQFPECIREPKTSHQYVPPTTKICRNHFWSDPKTEKHNILISPAVCREKLQAVLE